MIGAAQSTAGGMEVPLRQGRRLKPVLSRAAETARRSDQQVFYEGHGKSSGYQDHRAETLDHVRALHP